MGDISDALRWVSSDQHRKQVVNDADLYLTPPVGGYGTLNMTSLMKSLKFHTNMQSRLLTNGSDKILGLLPMRRDKACRRWNH